MSVHPAASPNSGLRGVHDAPELLFFRRDFDSWASCPVHSKDFFHGLRFRATSLGWDFNLVPQFRRIRIMLNGAAAHNDHTLTESPYIGGIAFHSLDDDSA